jgi:hypothetical protein
MEEIMFNIKPENLVGDTNKLLYSILMELKQLNDSIKPMRPVARDVMDKPKVEKKTTVKPKPKKGVTNNVGKLGQTRKLSKV